MQRRIHYMFSKHIFSNSQFYKLSIQYLCKQRGKNENLEIFFTVPYFTYNTLFYFFYYSLNQLNLHHYSIFVIMLLNAFCVMYICFYNYFAYYEAKNKYNTF